jgi:hypothetical protein
MERRERLSTATGAPGDGARHFVLNWLDARPVRRAFNRRLGSPLLVSPEEFGAKTG